MVDLKAPTASIQGPKVMIVDESAGTGGVHVGRPGGHSRLPRFHRGGGITGPNLAIWTEDGWIVENERVPPDIDVEQTPADVIAGRDP